jgi:deoxycytidine triphosphate deaminase
VTPEEKAVHIEAMHFACRKVRLAIAVLDADVPPDETTAMRLVEAVEILNNVALQIVGADALARLRTFTT